MALIPAISAVQGRQHPPAKNFTHLIRKSFLSTFTERLFLTTHLKDCFKRGEPVVQADLNFSNFSDCSLCISVHIGDFTQPPGGAVMGVEGNFGGSPLTAEKLL